MLQLAACERIDRSTRRSDSTGLAMEGDVCGLCGGDGRIGNALGRSETTCPSCHGSGRRAESSSGFHDVTKTKPSHYQRQSVAAAPEGPKGPTTSEGAQLASDVNASTVLAADAKARLVAEIINHESTHGRCTKTFIKRSASRPGQRPEKKRPGDPKAARRACPLRRFQFCASPLRASRLARRILSWSSMLHGVL